MVPDATGFDPLKIGSALEDDRAAAHCGADRTGFDPLKIGSALEVTISLLPQRLCASFDPLKIGSALEVEEAESRSAVVKF